MVRMERLTNRYMHGSKSSKLVGGPQKVFSFGSYYCLRVFDINGRDDRP